MFKQLIQSYPTKNTFQQKNSYLQQVLGKVSNLDGSIITKELQSQYKSLIDIFKLHPQVSIDFLFSKITLQDCIHLMLSNEGKQPFKQNHIILKALEQISVAINSQKDKEFLEWFSKMYTRYASYQKILVFLKFLSSDFHNKFTDQFFPQFLADFIRASAIGIEAYLKLKGQSPKFDFEYMEHGQLIVNSTQKWIKTFYIKLLKNLRIPKQSSSLKRSVLNAICDIIGALMEVQREGNIQTQICEQILNQCYTYLKKITDLREFNNLYMDLVKQKKYNISHRKILIPEKYTQKQITFPKQSYAYMIFKFLEQSTGIYSHEQIVRYLLSVINQLCQFDYEMKSKVQKMFLQNVSFLKDKIQTFLQNSFPLSILWFNLTHYKVNRNQKFLQQVQNILQKICQKSPQTYVNYLKLLSEYKAEGFQNQKLQMIGQKILSLKNSNLKELKILIKVIDWNEINEKGEKVWSEVILKLSESKESKDFLKKTFSQKQINANLKSKLLEVVQK